MFHMFALSFQASSSSSVYLVDKKSRRNLFLQENFRLIKSHQASVSSLIFYSEKPQSKKENQS